MATTKQLPAGKSKAARTAAAKRKLTQSKKSTSNKSKPPKKVDSKKKVTTSDIAAPTAPVSAQAPVSSPTGSTLSAENWQSDQSRLQSLSEDQDTVDTLNQEEVDADSSYETAVADAKKTAGERQAELEKAQAEFERNKADDYKAVNTNMAYRGAARSSAADRGVRQVGDMHTKIAGDLSTEKGKAAGYVGEVETKANLAREGRKAYVAKRRLTLSTRASAGGVYSTGAGEGNGGVTAPGINDGEAPAAPASPAATPAVAKTYKGKYKGPDKYKGDQKKIAAAKKAAAAKRRIVNKKGKK